MFSKPFISSVSRLLLGSFLYLNLHSTAVAFIPQENFIREQAPHLIVQTVMAPLLEPLDLQEHPQKVAALRVLKDVDGVYQPIHFFNFLTDLSTRQSSSDTQDDYDVSDSDEEGLEEILDHQKVYSGHINTLGDFIVAEDGSMIFRGDSKQRLSSIAFDTEKSLILDHLNTEKAILSASQAVLRSKASIGSLTLHLQQNAPASLHMLPGSLLQTHEVNLQGGHFVNEGTVEFLNIGGLKVGDGTFYNRGEIHSVHKLSLEAKGLVNAISGNVEAAQLDCQINNAFNLGKLKSSQFTADIAGNFEQSGTIESKNLCSIKAQNYSQKGKLKASQVILKAENHSLQGMIESSSLKIHSDQRVEILKPLQGESLHFMGKGTVVNRAGIRTTQQLVFENTQTENHAEIVSQGNLKISGSFTNHKSLILDGEMQLTPKARLQNGTQDNKQATFTVEKAIFDKASFQNYGTAALAHFFGDCSCLDLYKGSHLAIQEADVKVESLQHQGSLSLTSGQIQLQKESQWQADLLSLESNQATLKSNQIKS